MSERIPSELERLVLSVHQRNGGRLAALDWQWRLLEPVLGLDSLDLAEIMVGIERQYGISPFETSTPPKTWGEVVEVLQDTTRRVL